MKKINAKAVFQNLILSFSTWEMGPRKSQYFKWIIQEVYEEIAPSCPTNDKGSANGDKAPYYLSFQGICQVDRYHDRFKIETES